MSRDHHTLGAQMKQDLDVLLEKHPAPWRIDMSHGPGAEILDAHDDTVVSFDDDDVVFHAGIVAAVNFYNAVTSPLPIRLSEPADAAFTADDAGGGP